MTKQQIFTTVRDHLLKQGKKSKMQWTAACKFHMVDNKGQHLQCAVGCLIPDSEYGEWMEHKGMASERFLVILKELGLVSSDNCNKGTKMRLLLVLQHVHDYYDVPEWRVKLESVAEEMGLVY